MSKWWKHYNPNLVYGKPLGVVQTVYRVFQLDSGEICESPDLKIIYKRGRSWAREGANIRIERGTICPERRPANVYDYWHWQCEKVIPFGG